MARVYLIRAALFLLPFAVWFAWREIARRTGRDLGATPWAWLVAGGALLAAASLIAGALIHPSPDTGKYIPAEVGPGGRVTPGRFVPSKSGPS